MEQLFNIHSIHSNLTELGTAQIDASVVDNMLKGKNNDDDDPSKRDKGKGLPKKIQDKIKKEKKAAKKSDKGFKSPAPSAPVPPPSGSGGNAPLPGFPSPPPDLRTLGQTAASRPGTPDQQRESPRSATASPRDSSDSRRRRGTGLSALEDAQAGSRRGSPARKERAPHSRPQSLAGQAANSSSAASPISDTGRAPRTAASRTRGSRAGTPDNSRSPTPNRGRSDTGTSYASIDERLSGPDPGGIAPLPSVAQEHTAPGSVDSRPLRAPAYGNTPPGGNNQHSLQDNTASHPQAMGHDAQPQYGNLASPQVLYTASHYTESQGQYQHTEQTQQVTIGQGAPGQPVAAQDQPAGRGLPQNSPGIGSPSVNLRGRQARAEAERRREARRREQQEEEEEFQKDLQGRGYNNLPPR